jgi:hypothetical protein
MSAYVAHPDRPGITPFPTQFAHTPGRVRQNSFSSSQGRFNLLAVPVALGEGYAVPVRPKRGPRVSCGALVGSPDVSGRKFTVFRTALDFACLAHHGEQKGCPHQN